MVDVDNPMPDETSNLDHVEVGLVRREAGDGAEWEWDLGQVLVTLRTPGPLRITPESAESVALALRAMAALARAEAGR